MTTSAETAMASEVALHVDEFERDGYTRFEGVYTSEQVAEFHRMRETTVRDWCYANGTTAVPDAVDDLVERFPRASLDAVAHPLLLGFAESLMGPVVQLDSAVVAGDPPVDPDHRGEPVVWHRDRFGFFPLGIYTRPLSIVFSPTCRT